MCCVNLYCKNKIKKSTISSLLEQTPNLGVCSIKSELFPKQITSFSECPEGTE